MLPPVALALLSGLVMAAQQVPVHAHVFVVVPASRGFSPGMDTLAVAGELKSRGHHLYVTTADSEVSWMERSAGRHQPSTTSTSSSSTGTLTFVTFPAPFRDLKEAISSSVDVKDMAHLSPLVIMRGLQKALMMPCEALFSNATALQVLQASGAEAVLTLGLPIEVDSCGCAVAHFLGLPLIAVEGNPMVFTPMNTPQFPSGLTREDLKTWWGCLTNIAVYILKQVLSRLGPWLTNPGWPKFRAINSLPPLTAVPGQCRPTLRLSMNTPLLEVPQPLAPGQMLLGPVSPRLPRPPSEQQAAAPDVWSFLQDSSPEAGVVLVGFGSTGLFGNSLDHTDFVGLAAGFSALAPTRVLWPLIPSNLPEGTTLEQLPLGENVKVVPWIDYNDVLGHPHTKVFVTHFGIHSKMEAAFHGVPTVGVPFQFEQAANGQSLVDLGIGEMCRQAVAYRTGRNVGVRFERNALRDLVKQVMADPKYAEAAARISVKMQLYYSFRRPVQRAADEVEVLLAQPVSHKARKPLDWQPQGDAVSDVAATPVDRDGGHSSSSSHESEL